MNFTWLKTDELEQARPVGLDETVNIIDLSDLKGVRLISTEKTFLKIRRRIKAAPVADTYYLGSGDFHHLTLAILPLVTEPFTLLVFDHHHDGHPFPFEGMTSCGSWLNEALQLPCLHEIILIGVAEKNASEAKESSRIRFLYEEEWSNEKLKEVAASISTKAIYISIDRDLLSTTEVLTDWDQGDVTLDQLMNALTILLKGRTLLGSDICGDIQWDPIDLLRNNGRDKRASEEINARLVGLLSSAKR